MKLWQKENTSTDKKIEVFTVGKDREMDINLAPFDVLGSLAHTFMLEKIGLLTSDEKNTIHFELKNIYKLIESGKFEISESAEDVHSQIEFMLTERLGESGKKIHSGRSRNDQVLTDIKLYMRHKLTEMASLIVKLFDLLQALSEKHKDVLLPGYTHLQIAMPSSFGLWFGAYAEALSDDLLQVQAAYKMINKNPLGSAAGYGASFPIDRQLTTDLLGFDSQNYNVVYAQMTRGKSEYFASLAISTVASSLSRMAMDICMYNSQNFGFFTLPDAFTTGSSIMPHKKNPDVAELLRGKTNRLKALPNEINLLLSNLPSGYHRELQLTKEMIMPAFEEIFDCLNISVFMLENIKVNTEIFSDKKYDLIFSVERVNELVLSGVAFRDAYKIVGDEINSGNFKPNKNIQHSHEGSIGNLCNHEIKEGFYEILKGFNFKKVENSIRELLK